MGTYLIENTFNPFDTKRISDKYLLECRKIWEETSKNNVEPIFTLKNLAILTNQDYKTLLYYTQRRVKPYQKKIIKKNNKLRELYIPRKNLAVVQRWIKNNILDRLKSSVYSTAYEKNSSIKKNAEAHISDNWLIKLDIKDFFSSIKEDSVYQIFFELGYPKLLSLELSRLCTIAEPNDFKDKIKPYFKSKGVLPQGACTSPKISNLYASKFDEEIALLLRKYSSSSYTRYSDDMSISGDFETYDTCQKIISDIREILKKYFLKLNDFKIRIVSPKMIKKVTGVNIINGELKPSKKIVNYINNTMYYIDKYGLESHLKKTSKTVFPSEELFKEHLLGKIYFVKSINHRIGSILLEKYYLVFK